VLLSGEVAAVKAAVEAAESCEASEGMMAQSAVIPSPHPEMVQSLL
jgi:microcompartment protein CcmL/EutN